MSPYTLIYGTGTLVLIVLWILYGVLGGSWNPWKLVEGSDGRASTSKLQWFLWTVVVIFSYSAFYASRAWRGTFSSVNGIPQNLLIAMGLSITTMAAAKGITVSYLANGRIVKPAAGSNGPMQKAIGPGAIFQDDDGCPDLSKIQMMAWTFIAIGIYLISIWNAIDSALISEKQASDLLSSLPDIDATLMVLMGLGQGAYLGKKLTTTTVSRLTGLSLGSGKPGIAVTIAGMSFGDCQNGSVITIDGNPYHGLVSAWTDSSIKFSVPAQQINGSNWAAGQRILIGLIINGQESTNTLPFTVE